MTDYERLRAASEQETRQALAELLGMLQDHHHPDMLSEYNAAVDALLKARTDGILQTLKNLEENLFWIPRTEMPMRARDIQIIAAYVRKHGADYFPPTPARATGKPELYQVNASGLPIKLLTSEWAVSVENAPNWIQFRRLGMVIRVDASHLSLVEGESLNLTEDEFLSMVKAYRDATRNPRELEL